MSATLMDRVDISSLRRRGGALDPRALLELEARRLQGEKIRDGAIEELWTVVDGVVASRRYFDLAPISECLPFQGRSGDDLDPFLPKLLGVETNRGEWKEPPIRGTNPRADNPRVMLTPKRPSEHDIGSESFLSDNGGAIPASVLQFTNTRSGDTYLNYCKARNLKLHPARMPIGLAEFFIKFLTTPKNLVLDPFGGSNVTGAAAEALKRRWIAIEADRHYIDGSRGRFESMPEVKVYDH